MGGCQNYGPILGPLITWCCIIVRNQKGAMILTTNHMAAVSLGALPRQLAQQLLEAAPRLPGEEPVVSSHASLSTSVRPLSAEAQPPGVL